MGEENIMNVCRKNTFLFLIILLITSIVIPSINASTVISANNMLHPGLEPPLTSLYFNDDTGYIILAAIDYPLNDVPDVIITYYKIDFGARQTYAKPFKIPEGIHVVEFWSIDNYDHEEDHKSAQLWLDTTPPTVEIIKPEAGKLYLFRNPIMNRTLSNTTFCIGQVPVIANADDHGGYGVNRVFFSYSDGDTSYDDNSSDGWSDIYLNMHFGNLTISVSAMDKKGLVSEPMSITILVYNFGLF